VTESNIAKRLSLHRFLETFGYKNTRNVFRKAALASPWISEKVDKKEGKKFEVDRMMGAG
jgi:hypothetical protein